MTEVLLLLGTALLFIVIGFLVGVKMTKKEDSQWHKTSQRFQRSILGGKFSEQIATLLPHFPQDLKASEARFLGDPIDFVFFKGKDEQNITEVVFLEVKSGKAQLSEVEKKLREAIEQKRVRWHEYRVPEEITTFDSNLRSPV